MSTKQLHRTTQVNPQQSLILMKNMVSSLTPLSEVPVHAVNKKIEENITNLLINTV